jgi:hypothetical protein
MSAHRIRVGIMMSILYIFGKPNSTTCTSSWATYQVLGLPFRVQECAFQVSTRSLYIPAPCCAAFWPGRCNLGPAWLAYSNRSASQRGKRHRKIKRRTSAECFQESDLSLSESRLSSCVLGPRCTVLPARVARKRESAVAWASTSRAYASASTTSRWRRAVWSAPCSSRRCASSKRESTGSTRSRQVTMVASGTAFLALDMRIAPEIQLQA